MRSLLERIRAWWERPVPIEVRPHLVDPGRTYVPGDHPEAMWREMRRW